MFGTGYERPKTDIPENWQEYGPGDVVGHEIDADTLEDLDLEEWWTSFSDETLNLLVDEALTNSYTLRIAAGSAVRARYGVEHG